MARNLLTVALVFIVAVLFAGAPKIGVQATEIEQLNPAGKSMKLSSLKGHLVLIDFWASWCGPCRRNNPGIVALYNQYKDAKFQKGIQGFTIFSVSLDKDKTAWENAIKQDKLDWPYHVSDLKGWSAAPAIEYGVRSIPTTILLDENNMILAINPSHDQIVLELNKRLKSSPPLPQN